jgi:hypothetical protein
VPEHPQVRWMAEYAASLWRSRTARYGLLSQERGLQVRGMTVSVDVERTLDFGGGCWRSICLLTEPWVGYRFHLPAAPENSLPAGRRR